MSFPQRNTKHQISEALRVLYELRLDRGGRRQPTFYSDLHSLDNELTLTVARHPYRLKRPQLQKLMKMGCFSAGARGEAATLPDQSYLYRISMVSKVLSYAGGWTSVYPRKEDHPWIAFRLWENAVDRTHSWLPLRKFAQGHFASPRGFSFWTNHELKTNDLTRLLNNIHSMGIPSDWLDEYCVVLRCNIDHLNTTTITRVPTVLDAFDSHIFHPTKEAEIPQSGVAIKLDLGTLLTAGHEEFALGPIQTSAIEMYPVLIPDRLVPYIESYGLGLLKSLEAYYSVL